MTSACGIIIGDEILSGKVRDTNACHLIQLLREIGVELRRLVVIADDPAAIAAEVAACSSAFDYVITSGGVGPTHDDRTMEGIARGFARPLVCEPELERLVRSHWGARVNDAALKMALVPEGARLLPSEDGLLPLVAVDNVFILPGIPKLFEAKLRRLRLELSGQPWILHSLFLTGDESSIAADLARVEQEVPGVRIGSYPRLDPADHRIQVTVESLHSTDADRAVGRLLEIIDPRRVVRVERGS